MKRPISDTQIGTFIYVAKADMNKKCKKEKADKFSHPGPGRAKKEISDFEHLLRDEAVIRKVIEGLARDLAYLLV